MTSASIFTSVELSDRRRGRHAFSLVEVVLALAICVFVLIAMLGLLSNGLVESHDSREQFQAANLATLLLAQRREEPTNVIANAILPALNQPYATNTTWVTFSGQSLPSATGAAFGLTYQTGTNVVTPGVAQVYLRFVWPPAANPGTAAGHYEVTTQILLPQ